MGCRLQFPVLSTHPDMLQRTPEPELMNEAQQARAYANADFSEPHDYFVSLFTQKFPSIPITGTVLDLGCGPADISRRFARAYPDCRIHGIDGAPNMLQLGRVANQQAQMTNRIELYEACLPCQSLPHTVYDVIISNSLLHHLHDPMVLWHSLQQFARSGAAVFIMDLLRPRSMAIARQLVEKYAKTEPKVLRDDFFASLCAAFTSEEIRQQLNSIQLDTLQLEVVSDRHLIIYGYLP